MKLDDYEDSQRGAVIGLLAQGRPAWFGAAKSAIFQWQFIDNPFRDRPPLLVGTLEGDLAVVTGFMPVPVRYQGRAETASWSCDTFLSSRYRGKGLGKQLMREVSRRSPVMLSFGISDMSDPILEAQGWVADRRLATFFRPGAEPGLRGLVKRLASRLARLGTRVPADIVPRQEAALPAGELDELWARVRAQYGNCVERSAAYLQWRYDRAPGGAYTWLTVRSGTRLRAALVVRHHAVESVLADYVGPLDDRDLMRALIAAAVARLLAAGTARIRCETTDPRMQAAVASLGFLRSRHEARFRARTGDGAADWFIMIGDSDNDMLALGHALAQA